MTHRLRVRPEAERDLDEACRWYREHADSIGEEFLDEVERCFFRITENPQQFPVVHGSLRRALLHRFPYGVFCTVDEDSVCVLAVLHQAATRSAGWGAPNDRWSALPNNLDPLGDDLAAGALVRF